ncbi:MAG: hypothetical protein ACRDJ1_04775 [Actinomycetota bacterium]
MSFILIGGAAANAHGSPSITQDVDICYARTAENVEHLVAALRAINARLRGVDPSLPFQLDPKTFQLGDSFTFTTDAGDLDCLGTPAGTSGYDELAANAETLDLGGFSVAITSLDDLIRMKRSAGRPKDRVELEILGALRDEIDRGP